MQRKWVRYSLIGLLVLLPFVVTLIYRAMTAPPNPIRIATGPKGGRYRQLAEELKLELERDGEFHVELTHTNGSMENLELLADGSVHFALYQPGTRDVLGDGDTPDTENIAFVANAYSETVFLIVRRDAGIKTAGQLKGKTVAIGLKTSGDYATSRMLLPHLGLKEADIQARHFDYDRIQREFAAGTLDAAIITTGTDAPILEQLLGTGKLTVLSLPRTEVFVRHNVSFHAETIPAGLYRARDATVPQRPVQTVAVSAQLLTSKDVRSKGVQLVASKFLNQKFLRRNELLELFRHGHDFAKRKPEFPIHDGANAVYQPGLRPVLNSDFVEAMEGMRSFIVSLIIAGFLLVRWWSKRKMRAEEHQLDGYIRSLLAIERAQLDLDDNPDKTQSDLDSHSAGLQKLLDDVTHLRQEALSEFTAHKLNEDRATDAFLEMCHALSDKINAKLTRLRLESGFRKLATMLSSEVGTGAE